MKRIFMTTAVIVLTINTSVLGQSNSKGVNTLTQLRSELRFAPANVSIGIYPALSGIPDPKNFTIDEYAEHQNHYVDATLAINVWRNLNMRLGIGYMNTLNPEKYFDKVLPFEEVEGVYDDVNGGWGNSVMRGLGGSNVFLGLGVSRSLYFGKFHVTPVLMWWYGTYQENYKVNGYEVIATGEYIDETLYTYIPVELGIYSSLGIDIEMKKHIFGLRALGGEDNSSGLCLRWGYKL
jgi:hypothetical protein